MTNDYLYHQDQLTPIDIPIVNFLAQVSYSYIRTTKNKHVFIPKETLETYLLADKDYLTDADIQSVKGALQHFKLVVYEPIEYGYRTILSFYSIQSDGLYLVYYDSKGLYYLCQYLLKHLKGASVHD